MRYPLRNSSKIKFSSDEECLQFLIDAFESSQKDLFYTDISSLEAKELGFHIARVWSKDLISLSLPSAVPVLHPRFQAYGGVKHEYPHPYP